MKIEIIAEDIPNQRLWRVRWDYKEAVRQHLVSALIRAWWRNRKYVDSCANNASALPPQRSRGRQEQIVGNSGGGQ